MSPGRESVLPHDHDVTFYDADSHLVDELAEFVMDGLALGESILLVATPEHHALLAATLAAAGCLLDDAASRGQYVAVDAAATSATFIRDGSARADLFFSHVGGLLERVARSGRPVRVFGEMVALLWQEGNVTAAIEVERLWNRLARLQRFSLLCGYPASSLTCAADLASVRSVCEVHSEVLPPASYEVGEAGDIAAGGSIETRVFVATPPAIRAVRQLVSETLRAWGLDALVPDATLLVSELATNAMRHASSPFRAAITRSAGTLRISVEDLGSSEPRLRPADLERLGGRGVALVDAMSMSWGCEPAPAGKVVWCELPVAQRRAV
ncbi:MAG: MEDS domain-containing protein [Frankiaceae bacterium]|nr:MEDS domain-containing protein [Frankiaceae bacterium]